MTDKPTPQPDETDEPRRYDAPNQEVVRTVTPTEPVEPDPVEPEPQPAPDDDPDTEPEV